MKTTHLRTRREGETGGERCLSRKVEILDDGSARERDGEGEQSVPLLCAFRTSGKPKAPRIL